MMRMPRWWNVCGWRFIKVDSVRLRQKSSHMILTWIITKRKTEMKMMINSVRSRLPTGAPPNIATPCYWKSPRGDDYNVDDDHLYKKEHHNISPSSPHNITLLLDRYQLLFPLRFQWPSILRLKVITDLEDLHIDENHEEPHHNLDLNAYDDEETKFLVKKNSSPTLNTNSWICNQLLLWVSVGSKPICFGQFGFLIYKFGYLSN